MPRLLLVLLFLLLGIRSAVAAEALPVVTFSPLLAEFARAVGGERVAVNSLMKPGDDPHSFQPTAADLRAVARGRVILLSGRDIEGVQNKLTRGAAPGAQVCRVGDQLPPLPPADGGMQIADDPHWWHSVAQAEQAVQIIRDALISAEPEERAEFTRNAEAFRTELAELQKWIRRKVAELPRDKRKLVTSHDAFRFFAREYGFAVYPIEGINSADEPSSRAVAQLVETIRREGVKAIFVEDRLNPKVTTEITRETGARIGGTLVADGLGTGEAATYAGMMRRNITTIVEALK